MAVKLLIAGESNAGKTTLTKGLEKSLVISHDGKRYPYKNPHASISNFSTSDELTSFVTEKIEAYNAKLGEYPSTVVFDSVSRIFDTLYDACNQKYTGFSVYSNLDREIKAFTNYIEDTLIASGIDVVILSHAIYDSETSKYNLVGKGSFAKIGSFLSVVDESIFIETKSNKRILHFRSTKFPARTLQEDNPDSMPVDDFNLGTYVSHLREVNSAVNEFEL
jgi:hypothetical protein